MTIVTLSTPELAFADEVAERCARYFTRDRFARAGGLGSDELRPERYIGSRRAEFSTAVILGLPWHGEPEDIEAGLPDVGDDIEVRYVTKRGYRLKYHPTLDHAARRYVLVYPARAEPGDRPRSLELMGWAWGRELADAPPNLELDDGARFYNAMRLRPFSELYSLV